MALLKTAFIALAALATAAQAENPNNSKFESGEAQVDPSYWINKACSGESVRFAIRGTQTDRALQEFGSAMNLPVPKNAVKKTAPRRVQGFQIAPDRETYGNSPSEPEAQASWDFSNENPQQGAACILKLKNYARRYGERLTFSDTPTGLFAALFNDKRPFQETIASRMQKLGKSEIATRPQSRSFFYDGGGFGNSQAGGIGNAPSGNRFSGLFDDSVDDRIREARSAPRAQAPGLDSLSSRSVPGPNVPASQKSWGEELLDWGERKYEEGKQAVKNAFGAIEGGITENINKIAGFFATSGSGGRYVRPYTRRIMEAWHKLYGKKIQITSASRFSKGGRRDYSDVHKGHKEGLTLDVGSTGAAENARMLHSLYQAGAPVSRMLHTYNADVIAAAGREYGSNSAYVQWLKRKLIYYKGHTGHIDVKFV